MSGKSLDPTVYETICSLASEGDALSESGDAPGAVAKYEAAWNLLPEPREDWKAATWLQGSIADAWYWGGEPESALVHFTKALSCPEGIGNPFIHLRLGELYFELGDRTRAGDHLTRAYMGAGEEIFANENPEYLAYVSQLLRL